ncbi:SDR family NAD(P)-dependent oxidoreductase [Fulvivirga sedimenti]|uniref:SDR family NAD(P)-dependent oxidoreductase n=1 Tax=Fulvivirga sedimenti TaxID=2879465 RepID=A0A9X1KUS6_9BACT|nr:SDR family NAD(P)-dependent oxidoreductase [Fulvivirga sedimenti]MCA6073848.1 SDR family NAD(P)-dependent oxidoreductase [Fulvivirga sedimenti]
MENRLAVITGANTGIGFQSARSLALQGYHVILTGRFEGKIDWASSTINAMCEESGATGKAFPMLLDLASFDSVLQFAIDFGLKYDRLDVLLCNAGVMNAPYTITENGFELQFQVNYLSHYLLTRLMMPYLQDADSPRLIQVTSMLGERAKSGSLKMFSEIAKVSKDQYSPLQSYKESKLAQMLLTRYINRIYREFLFTAAVHPGVVNSDLFYRRVPKIAKSLLKPVAWLGYVSGTLKTPYDGADTSIWLAAEKEPLPSGKYWYERKTRPWSEYALDDNLAADLWDWSGEQVRTFLG